MTHRKMHVVLAIKQVNAADQAETKAILITYIKLLTFEGLASRMFPAPVYC